MLEKKGALIIFTFIFTLSIVAGGFAIRENVNSENAFKELEKDNFESLIILSNIERALWELRFALPNYVTEGKEGRDKINKRFPELKTSLQENLDEFSLKLDTPEKKVLFENFHKPYDSYMQYRTHYFELLDQGKNNEANIYRLQYTKPMAAKSIEALEVLIGDQHAEADERVSNLTQKLKNTRWLMAIYILLEITLCFVLWKVIANSRRKMESSQQASIQSSKMASLGEMTSGIAHEINNPLAIIQGRSTQLLRMMRTGEFTEEQATENLEKIVQTSERIVKIINVMKSISKNADEDNFKTIAITQLHDNVVGLCAEKYRINGIKLDVNSIPNLLLECREAQIQQVILNLLNNAFDAVANLSEKWVHVEFNQVEENLQILVTDSGKGIPPANAKKLMLPFFTTKEIGKGIGLGLCVSKGIIERHHGVIRYDADCENTRFVITLPLKQNKINS
jgi:C4-dicarboxylate-specific signal transduction histidine kinase